MSEFDLNSIMQQAQMLQEKVKYMQKGLETEQVAGAAHALWGARGTEMASMLAAQAGGVAAVAATGESPFTLGAFAWGGVWYQTLAAAFSSPECRAALATAAADGVRGKGSGWQRKGERSTGPSVVVLGSSIGFEVRASRNVT